MMNPVIWFEVPVTNIDRAKKFYRDVFGYEYQMLEMGPLQIAVIEGDMNAHGATGGLIKGEDYVPSKTGTYIYFSCDDVNIELEKIEKAGGKVLVPKTSIGESGFIAHFIDSEGNRVGLHSDK
ncbi:VOC family protein [candidate division KSB1 bacterium]|nr:VOC family protein [candidate division KSB1 bacterium]